MNTSIKTGIHALILAGMASGFSMQAAQAALLTAKTYAESRETINDQDSSTDEAVSSEARGLWNQYVDGAEANAYAAADQDGWMYAYSEANGSSMSRAEISQSVTFINDTGSAQSYSFDFLILPGRLEVEARNYLRGEWLEAGYQIDISLDGVSLFSSSAEIRVNGTRQNGPGSSLPGATYSPPIESAAAGTDLGGRWRLDDEFGSYRWRSYQDVLDLGVVQAGQSFTLTYDIKTYVEGSVLPGTWVCISLECGQLGVAAFGDPNHLNSAPLSMSQLHYKPAGPVSVPEPGLWLLMGAGLFGLAIARRRVGRG